MNPLEKQTLNITPHISVLMSVYHEPIDWLALSVDSILNQSFSDFEFIIIVDDPNNQEAINYIRQKAEEDNRIVLLINEENVGLTKSLNKGLKIAKGNYIARMDADDISYPERFEKQFTFMESHPSVILLGTGVRYFGDLREREIRQIIYQSDNDKIKASMLFNSGFSHPTIMIRRKILVDNGVLYDENYRQTQDYRLYETLYDLGDFANLPEVLLDYRKSKEQISTRLYKRQGGNMQQIRRRLLNKWLVDIGYHELDFNYQINRLLIRKNILNLIDKKNVFFKVFMKTMYFTNTKNKIGLFVKSVINGDFFRMSIRERRVYLGIVLGKVSAMPL